MNVLVLTNNCVLSLGYGALFQSCAVHGYKVVGCASGVGLLPAVLGPSFLDKGVGVGPAATQVGLALRKLS